MTAQIERPNYLEFGIHQPSETTLKLIQEHANQELDWLWAADQAQSPAERYFCIAYALYINPDNIAARRALQQFLAHKQQPVQQPSILTAAMRRLLTSVFGS